MEILAVEPALGEGFTAEPIFVREDLGAPLMWTGHLSTSDLMQRAEAALPAGATLRELCEGSQAPW
jgi:hypothetical protein